MNDEIRSLVKTIYESIDDKLGEDIKILNLSGLSPIADYFVIATAGSDRQAKAIVKEIEDNLAKRGVFARGREGLASAAWILLDFGDIIVHIFKGEERKFYDLERIWKDAKDEKIENL
ncbi:iojap-like protein [Peptoclostridium acidaminophilum DSM 3953]|uniref:Ribosomal silencing factor RsfS n=1 Tax=Peptoclostridium acidaminophilum DSM 3953 TaxID=1286171 RepID=W8T6F3_PEPAC|nr:ribosome silencing factor [Peptoclostridium acidaminophilum]AHM56465.1 iojap-like protein [Peptoclostridium acidaminophilum DSM 3953]